MDNLVDGTDPSGSLDLDDMPQPLITFPDRDSPPPNNLQLDNLQSATGL